MYTRCPFLGPKQWFPSVSVVDNSSNWAVCGKSSGVIAMPVAAQATHRVHMEVMPLFAGYLPLPDVRLFKYLPHHSAHSTQLDAGKDSACSSVHSWGGVVAPQRAEGPASYRMLSSVLGAHGT